jgi:HrpA-like RNA helicase
MPGLTSIKAGVSEATYTKLYEICQKHHRALQWAWSRKNDLSVTSVSEKAAADEHPPLPPASYIRIDHDSIDPETFTWRPDPRSVPQLLLPPPHPNRPTELPAFNARDTFIHALQRNQVVIVAAATGAGKSTQFPQFILDWCRAYRRPCRIVCSQPRRLAAMTLAKRVAHERGFTLDLHAGVQDHSVERLDAGLWQAARNSALVRDAEQGLGRPDEADEGESFRPGEDNAEDLLAAPAPAPAPARHPVRGHGPAPGAAAGDVGFAVRYQRVNPGAPISFVTVGLLLRRMTDQRTPLPPATSPEAQRGRALCPTDDEYWTHPESSLIARLRHNLRYVTHIVVDEVHEREKNTDLTLCLLRSALAALPDLKLIVMSATLSGPLISQYFNGAPIVVADGRTFPVSVLHFPELCAMTGYRASVENATFSNSVSARPLLKQLAQIKAAIDKRSKGVFPSGPSADAENKLYYCANEVPLAACMADAAWRHEAPHTVPLPQPDCGALCACHIVHHGLAVCAQAVLAVAKPTAIIDAQLPALTHCLRWLAAGPQVDDPLPGEAEAETAAAGPGVDALLEDARGTAYGGGSAYDGDIDFDSLLELAPSQAHYPSQTQPEAALTQAMHKLSVAPAPAPVDTTYMLSAPAQQLASQRPRGSVLVFLPGWAEIMKVRDELAKDDVVGDADRFVVLPLHSQVPPEEQERAFLPVEKHQWKIVLATNVAETSVTIPDCVYVVDMGIAKVKGFSVASDMSTFNVEWCAKANCTQRAGRAGRVRPGFCFRLFPAAHLDDVPEYETPELLRSSLEDALLYVKSLQSPSSGARGVARPSERHHAAMLLARLLEAPSPAHISMAVANLQRIGALDGEERVTPMGEVCQQRPLEARHTRLLLLGASVGVLDHALTAVAASGTQIWPSGMKFRPPHEQDMVKDLVDTLGHGTRNELLSTCHAYFAWQASGPIYRRKDFARRAMMLNSGMHNIANARKHIFWTLSRVPALAPMMSRLSVTKGGEMVYLRTVAPGQYAITPFPYAADCYHDVLAVVDRYMGSSMVQRPPAQDPAAGVPALNRHAAATALVSLALAAGVYPNVATPAGRKASYVTRMGATAQAPALGGKALCGPAVAGYNECVSTLTSTMLRQVAPMPMLALLLWAPALVSQGPSAKVLLRDPSVCAAAQLTLAHLGCGDVQALSEATRPFFSQPAPRCLLPRPRWSEYTRAQAASVQAQTYEIFAMLSRSVQAPSRGAEAQHLNAQTQVGDYTVRVMPPRPAGRGAVDLDVSFAFAGAEQDDAPDDLCEWVTARGASPAAAVAALQKTVSRAPTLGGPVPVLLDDGFAMVIDDAHAPLLLLLRTALLAALDAVVHPIARGPDHADAASANGALLESLSRAGELAADLAEVLQALVAPVQSPADARAQQQQQVEAQQLQHRLAQQQANQWTASHSAEMNQW